MDENEYEQLRGTLLGELAPEGMLETAHATEIIGAIWRLRVCSGPEHDRTRAAASNCLRRSTAELRRLQTDRRLAADLGPVPGLTSRRDLISTLLQVRKLTGLHTFSAVLASAEGEISDKNTKQTQSPPRNALCPCGSRKKYKRCCIGQHPNGPATSVAAPNTARTSVTAEAGSLTGA